MLFFRKNGSTAAPQTVSARLRRLTNAGYLSAVVIDRGRGSGPYAYALSSLGYQALGLRVSTRPPGGPVQHDLEVADFRIALEYALRPHGGRLVEWLGEPQLRGLIRKRNMPVPDALVHWKLRTREGAFFLEHDRGTETLATLTAKLEKYAGFWKARSHRLLLPGLGLRPRLIILVGSARSRRLVTFLEQHPVGTTVLVGVYGHVLDQPLGRIWWRSDLRDFGSLVL